MATASSFEAREWNAVLWYGSLRRRQASVASGRLRLEAVAPIFLRAIVHAEAEEDRGRGEAAAMALHSLGAGDLVRAIRGLLRRQPGNAAYLSRHWRNEVIRSLTQALTRKSGRALADLVWALADLGAVEALPDLRALKRPCLFAAREVRVELRHAISHLERSASLPRHAATKTHADPYLPRPVDPVHR